MKLIRGKRKEVVISVLSNLSMSNILLIRISMYVDSGLFQIRKLDRDEDNKLHTITSHYRPHTLLFTRSKNE
jgi:hypothetical protein